MRHPLPIALLDTDGWPVAVMDSYDGVGDMWYLVPLRTSLSPVSFLPERGEVPPPRIYPRAFKLDCLMRRGDEVMGAIYQQVPG